MSSNAHLPEFYLGQYESIDPSKSRVELLGEPVTLEDGTEVAIFEKTLPLIDQRKIEIVRVRNETVWGAHYLTEEEVTELGNGSYSQGIIEAFKLYTQNYWP